MRSSSGTGRAISVGLSLVPLAYVIYSAVRWHVDVPFWDQWTLVPLIVKSYDGALNLHDVWAQHNEHRLLFPRLLMIQMAKLSGWRVLWEVIASILFSIGAFASIAVHLIKPNRKDTDWGRATVWLLPATSLILFSMSQWESWLWGWNLQITLVAFLLVVVIMSLTRARERKGRATVFLCAASGDCRFVFVRCGPSDLAHWGGGHAFSREGRGATRDPQDSDLADRRMPSHLVLSA